MSASRQRFPFPIAVLTFARPALVADLCDALLAQSEWEIDQNQLFFFQDGPINPWSNEKKCALDMPQQNQQAISARFPNSHIFNSTHNLGIALNYVRAEDHVFETLGSDFCVFIEDDVLPLDGYLTAMRRYAAIMSNRNDIACGIAMGDIYDKEPASTSDLIRGYHYWGYITSRKHSLEQRAALDPYYQIVKDVDYSYRPSARIIEWYRTLGIEAGFCSQDAARAYVTALRLKRARLNTRLAFATVRAVAGEHGSEDFINGLARAARGTTAHAATLSIDDAAVLGILRAQQAEAREPTPSNIAPRLPRWERKMLTPESIEWCYRIFLGRDPEPGAIEAHMGGQMSLGEFRDQTMASDEFRRRQDLQ